MRKTFATMTLLMAFVVMYAQMFEPVHWNVSHRQEGTTLTVRMSARIDAGFHLYATDVPEDGPQRTEFTFETVEGLVANGAAEPIEGKKITVDDPMFGMQLSFYEKEVVFAQKFDIVADAWKLDGYVYYMACNDETCLAPTRYEFALSGKGVAKSSEKKASANTLKTNEESPAKIDTLANVPTPQVEAPVTVADADGWSGIYRPVIDEMNALGGQMGDLSGASHGLWYIFILGFVGGLVALITPCVWPIIPLTVSFFLKKGTTKKSSPEEIAAARKRGIRDAIIYGLSIVVIYVSLGLVITGAFGASALNSLATNAVFNIIFFLMLVLFGASFIGGFELTLPSSWSNAVDNKANSTSGLLSIFLMAFTLVLVSFSCTGPIIGFLLVEMVTSSIVGPTVGMLGFAVALALPFTLFALFPTMLKSAPKSGNWMNNVKVTLGFIELAFSLKFLSVADLAYGWGILDRETFLALWIALFALLGAYLIGWIRFPHDEDEYDELGNVIVNHRTSIPRFFVALISFAFAIYMIPGLWGAPCKAISAFTPPLSTQDFVLGETSATIYHSYEEGMAAARRENKPVLVDFSGFGCVNCRKMEAAVWSDPEVKRIIDEEYILIELMVDDKADLPVVETVTENGREVSLRTVGDKWSYLQRYKFGANAQPFYVLLDADGTPLNGSYSYNEDVAEYVNFLNKGLERWKK
ncbi:MAG: thioredoxin family protein [Bacteroidales bacterium]|nr:thioredoxin family protein [Bacteroidales bacterium]